jgi:glutamate N-acetyltransferase/amino-acid N-acetyltransferase
MSMHIPAGFLFAAASAGIKASGRPDLAYAEAPQGAIAAALFTRNRVVASPVVVGRDHLKRTAGRLRAVIVNSGNANCANGKDGLRACERLCQSVAGLIETRPREVFPSSTGIIGVPFPTEKALAGLPALIADRGNDEAAVRRFAEAIMTTDTRPKIASASFGAETHAGSVLGVAKGSGMIAPNLATMLVYLFTDLQGDARGLRQALTTACDRSFNCICVDNDSSTNDTVLLLASGQSQACLRAEPEPFSQALTSVCRSLAEQIVSDGEGVKHVVRLHIEGARQRAEALVVARSIARSMLVKTALSGCDPNWGRILAATGYSGVEINPKRVNIYIGSQQVCRQGNVCQYDAAAAHAYLCQPSYDIRVQLGRGRAGLEFLTTDLTTEYVKINGEYST